MNKIIDFKNSIVIAVTLAVMLFIGVLLPNLLAKKPTHQVSEGLPAITVDYTDDGFSPNIITVKNGTTVGWVNHSLHPMWVASDPHPAHNELPGFDSRRPIHLNAAPSFIERAYAHGEPIYQYTFTATGTWSYHNHLNPQHVGSVIVEE